VEDTATGGPISGATVFSADSTVSVVADSLGRFSISLPVDGPFVVYAEQFGYLARSFDLSDATESELAELALDPAPFELEGITAVAEAALGRLLRNIEMRRTAHAHAMIYLDRTELERFGPAATVLDLIRIKSPRISTCFRPALELCTASRFITFRDPQPRATVMVCINEARSYFPVADLPNLSVESVAIVEFFGVSAVRVYTVDWMLDRASKGRTRVTPDWMDC